jgi:predicted DNA-binding transcriptional regulator AlpA
LAALVATVFGWYRVFWGCLGRAAHLGCVNEPNGIGGLEPLVSTSQLAVYLGVAPQAIYDLRTAGRGPRAVKVGRELRYRISEVEAWLSSLEEPGQAGKGASDGR